MNYTETQNDIGPDRMSAVLTFTKTILSTRQLDRALDTVLDGILHSTQMERGFLMLHNQNGKSILKAARDARGNDLQMHDFQIDYPLLSRALTEPKVSLFTYPATYTSHQTPVMMRTCLCVPIFSIHSGGPKKIAGVLYTDRSGSAVSRLDDDVLEIANVFALQAGLVLDVASIYELANYDDLTRLHQRRYFDAAAHVEWERASRHKRPLSIVMADLDDFKRVNDLLGHDQGDNLLRNIAQILKESSRKEDIVARYGGDEFVLLLPETGSFGAIAVAERIHSQVSRLSFPCETGKVTISLGLASYPASKAASIQELIKLADQALYAAKDKGKNRWISSRQKDHKSPE